MQLEELKKRNRAFVAGRQAVPFPAAESIPLAVVACYDPRLDPLLRPAVGLAEGEGFMIRTAGALIAPDSKALNSLAVAVYLFDVKNVLIVGHSSCRMASFDSAAFAEAFRRRGVSREAFGDESLRQWVGAFASPREGVLASAAAIAGAVFLPDDLAITGAILDDSTGALDVVLKPGDPIPGRALERYGTGSGQPAGSDRSSTVEATVLDTAQATPASAGASSAATTRVGDASNNPPPVPTEALLPNLKALRNVAHKLSKESRGSDLRRLRAAYRAEGKAVRKLEMLRKYVGQGAMSSEVHRAFLLLRHEGEARGWDLASKTIEDLFKPLVGDDKA